MREFIGSGRMFAAKPFRVSGMADNVMSLLSRLVRDIFFGFFEPKKISFGVAATSEIILTYSTYGRAHALQIHLVSGNQKISRI